jgi:regulator of sigma E protease
MTAQLLLSLSILIVVHEWGHFVTARMFKIKVEKFYLFFDFLFPLANVLNFSLIKFKKGDTEYGIGWFPLGGYVKIAGMVDESMDKEQMNAPAQPWEFRSKPAWQRLIVMLGGIIVNVIVGVIIFVGLTYIVGDEYVPKNYVNTHGGIQALEYGEQIGLRTGDKLLKINGKDFDDFGRVADPKVLLANGSYYTVERDGKLIDIQIPGNFIENFNNKKSAESFIHVRYEAVIGKVLEEIPVTEETKVTSLAKNIGLKVGDRFLEIDGQPVTYQDELQALVKKHRHNETDPLANNDSVAFKIQRDGQVIAFKEPLTAGQIGFYPMGIDKSNLASIQYDLKQSIGLGTTRAFEIIFVQLQAFGKIFRGEISLRNSLSGPVGMAQAYGPEWDWQRFWKMTGLLSMVLAFMNLLPIPALDGGYVTFLLYEMVTGRTPSEKFFETSLKIGMALLLLLMVFVFYNDFAKLFSR